MKTEIIMNHFVNGIIMGKEMFIIYEEKAQDRELKRNLKDFISSFDNQKSKLKKVLQKQGFSVEEECTTLQKNAIMIEKIKTKVIKNDFELCLNIINAMNGAIIGALKYYNKCDKDLRHQFQNSIEDILINYDNIIGKIKSYVLKILS